MFTLGSGSLCGFGSSALERSSRSKKIVMSLFQVAFIFLQSNKLSSKEEGDMSPVFCFSTRKFPDLLARFVKSRRGVCLIGKYKEKKYELPFSDVVGCIFCIWLLPCKWLAVGICRMLNQDVGVCSWEHVANG
ncbi:hypothetical protein AVEN_37743-1 [Araneus ventricosus]|uniref:Uncharacterized protein n=1 Tax=Araneus ventricosus TaxID=182803 RepID=A0A4Y2BSV5_ARAVE|nr:hypothetical protein AVEN_37743-1 [Araneus ventricosus]